MLRARDVMQPIVATVSSDLPLPDLEALLLREAVSGLPVVDGGELRGVVSRTDILHALTDAVAGAEATLAYYHEIAGASVGPASAAHMAGERIAAAAVRDVMSTELIVAGPEEPVQRVAETLVHRGVHRVLVTEKRRLLGLVTTLDLVRAIADGKLA